MGGRHLVRSGSLLQIPGWMAHRVQLEKARYSMTGFDARCYPAELTRSLDHQRLQPRVLQRPSWSRWFEGGLDHPEELLWRLSRETAVDSPVLVSQALALAHEGVARGWGPGEVAGRLGYSLPHLTTQLSRFTGRSLGQWMVEARLELAEMLLRDGHLTVAQVAERCGYVDLSHFRRAYKKRAGRSPREVVHGCL